MKQEALIKQWTAFCNFHLGNYKLALDEYEKLRKSDHQDVGGDEIELNIAICMFYLGERTRSEYDMQMQIFFEFKVNSLFFVAGMYTEAQAIIETIPNSPLKVRLLFHLAHKLNDEDRLLELHGSLRDVNEDQLSLASMHYLRAHYQDAIDIYKRLLLDKK